MKQSNRTLLCLLAISVIFNISAVMDVRSFRPGDMIVTKLRAGEEGKTLADVYMVKEKPVPWFPVPWKWRATLLHEGITYAEPGKITLFREGNP